MKANQGSLIPPSKSLSCSPIQEQKKSICNKHSLFSRNIITPSQCRSQESISNNWQLGQEVLNKDISITTNTLCFTNTSPQESCKQKIERTSCGQPETECRTHLLPTIAQRRNDDIYNNMDADKHLLLETNRLSCLRKSDENFCVKSVPAQAYSPSRNTVGKLVDNEPIVLSNQIQSSGNYNTIIITLLSITIKKYLRKNILCCRETPPPFLIKS